MTADNLDLHTAATALIEVLAGEAEAWARLPVPMRAVMAAAALGASGRAVNGVALASAGRYSRGTASRTDSPWRDLIAALSDNGQALADTILRDTAPSPNPTRLAADLAARDRTIAELRDELSSANAALQPLADYAHDLAVELRQHREDERAALAAKIVPLRLME